MSRVDGVMDTTIPTDLAATVIIGQKVRAGVESAYQAWQLDMNAEAAKYPGFLGAEINPPTAVQPDWVVVYRFGSVANVQAWINSATRQGRLDSGRQYFDGPGTQQVVSGGARATDPLVTVVVAHRVDPENVDDFLAWQERLRLAESKFVGFRGTELFRPVQGVQEEWTALYRYDNAADLDTLARVAAAAAIAGRGRSVLRLPVPDNRQFVRQLVRLRPARHRGRPAVGNQDLDRRLGWSVSDGRLADARAVAVQHAAVARAAHRKPGVQLHHELRHDAVLRQSTAQALASAATECFEGPK